MNSCQCCGNRLLPTRLECHSCEIVMEAEFNFPRLARLKPESQKLAESFILAGGNLKDLAVQLDISYPTLRKKIDQLILELSSLYSSDQKSIDKILADVEQGKLSSEKGLRMIKELNGEI